MVSQLPLLLPLVSSLMHWEPCTSEVKTTKTSHMCLAAVGLLNLIDFSGVMFVYIC